MTSSGDEVSKNEYSWQIRYKKEDKKEEKEGGSTEPVIIITACDRLFNQWEALLTQTDVNTSKEIIVKDMEALGDLFQSALGDSPSLDKKVKILKLEKGFELQISTPILSKEMKIALNFLPVGDSIEKKLSSALNRIIELEKKLVDYDIGLELSLEAVNFDRKSGIWLDKSARGRHARCFDSKGLPDLVHVTYNGKTFQSVQFQPDRGLKIGSDTDYFKPPLTIIIVCRYCPNATAKGRLLQSRSAGTNWLLGLWNGQRGYHAGRWVPNALPVTVGEYGIHIGTIDSALTGSYYFNGTLVGSTSPCVAPELLGLGSGTYDERSQAEATTILIYSRILSDLERTKIVKTLSEKYGVQLG